jgi:hypothetical protein
VKLNIFKNASVQIAFEVNLYQPEFGGKNQISGVGSLYGEGDGGSSPTLIYHSRYHPVAAHTPGVFLS